LIPNDHRDADGGDFEIGDHEDSYDSDDDQNNSIPDAESSVKTEFNRRKQMQGGSCKKFSKSL